MSLSLQRYSQYVTRNIWSFDAIVKHKMSFIQIAHWVHIYSRLERALEYTDREYICILYCRTCWPDDFNELDYDNDMNDNDWMIFLIYLT